jgi:peptide/nickel transport system substrate-binding protein
MRRVAAVVVGLSLAAACTGSGGKTTRSPTPGAAISRGGVLRVLLAELPGVSTLATAEPNPGALDPQLSYWSDAWELFRCCLLRTLLSYNGRTTDEGGTELRPDLAASLPDVSQDGLTWTFRMRAGLHYAPPLQGVEITSTDVVRALAREARIGTVENGGYAFYYSAIQGFDDFAAGTATSVAGLQAPNPHTLVVRLTHPEGDFGNMLALPASAPIPPNPLDRTAPFGVASGHDKGYGRFLVASGPYMVAGSGKLNFSLPPKRQRPAAGFTLAKSINLVRSPSWSPATDPLRPAYPNRIEIRIGGTVDDLAPQVERGQSDLLLFSGLPPQIPADVVARVDKDPSLGRVVVDPRDFVRRIDMNLAIPPFDDVHVRRAVNYVIDKRSLVSAAGGGPLVGRVATHIAPDSLEENLLLNYDPYATPGERGSLSLARKEMALSRYDGNGDGRCDTKACNNVNAVSLGAVGALPSPVAVSEMRARARVIANDLSQIGIHIKIDFPQDAFAVLRDPTKKVGLGLSVGWGKDIPNGSNFFEPLFSPEELGNNNYTLVGASPDQLQEWGYGVSSVPSVDDRIAQCAASVRHEQVVCWANLDKYLMERVVPWIPYVVESHEDLISNRVAHFSFDQSVSMPALDQIALTRKAIAEDRA